MSMAYFTYEKFMRDVFCVCERMVWDPSEVWELLLLSAFNCNNEFDLVGYRKKTFNSSSSGNKIMQL
jgi:hypothetical protein